ncbi:hypothetical protein [Massilia timonae]|uniref:hypothetical protein n=1 Tax=Massilia timonae TaxID=47229 RepID=UPI0028D30C51|nr:hypothetical protein [Massilia timonae]
MSEILREYFAALDRLIVNKPVNVRKGSKITNDTVSLEAGRKKGTIKKSRPIFKELIDAISAAAKVQSTALAPHDEVRERLVAAKLEVARYRTLWEEALAREVSLVQQLWSEREIWAKERAALTGSKVISIANIQVDAIIKDSNLSR